MKKKICVFLFDGFADWEIAYLMPEIKKRSDKFELISFTLDGKPVHSMGGLHVTPEMSLLQLKPDEIFMLILPGGTAWEKGGNTAIDGLLDTLFAQDKCIAAICGATFYLGQKGCLDHVEHTSNDLYYLKAVSPAYAGALNYADEPAVTGQNIITAKGVAPIEFAREIFEKIELTDKQSIEKWFQLFKHGIWSE